jgi:hypothetical protein
MNRRRWMGTGRCILEKKMDGNRKMHIGKEDGWEDGKCWKEEKE